MFKTILCIFKQFYASFKTILWKFKTILCMFKTILCMFNGKTTLRINYITIIAVIIVLKVQIFQIPRMTN